MQTKVKYSVFPHIKGFFKDKTLRNRDKKLYLCTTKINRNAQDSPDNFVNSCYLYSAIIGENTFQEEWTLP